MSSHHHLILFHLNVLNHHISSLHFFSAHSSSVTSLFFPSICSLPPTCFRATLSSSSMEPVAPKLASQGLRNDGCETVSDHSRNRLSIGIRVFTCFLKRRFRGRCSTLRTSMCRFRGRRSTLCTSMCRFPGRHSTL